MDNVDYQKLFGGQAMITLVTMDEGHTVDELFTAEQATRSFDKVGKSSAVDDGVLGVIDPVTALDFSAIVGAPSE